jgi:hypothetical protein
MTMYYLPTIYIGIVPSKNRIFYAKISSYAVVILLKFKTKTNCHETESYY